VTELSTYHSRRLRDGPFTLSRGPCRWPDPILLVAPAGDYPSLESLQRLEHEYALRAEPRRRLGSAAAGAAPARRADSCWCWRPWGRAARTATRPAPDRCRVPAHRHPTRDSPRTGARARARIHKGHQPAKHTGGHGIGRRVAHRLGIASHLPREHQIPAPPEVMHGTARLHGARANRRTEPVGRLSERSATRRGVTFYEMPPGRFHSRPAIPWSWCTVTSPATRPAERSEFRPCRPSSARLC